MTPSEYKHARHTLGWTHEEVADALGVNGRTPFRWASGKSPMQGPETRLLRLLVLLHLRLSKRKFEEILEGLDT
jgi:DNA-binding transcriptional regulator YiaG